MQNATLRCDLPSPAVAVRNLVEQAQHAHLCTLMSAMHHRRAGYPFGTVVEFAADGAGHPLFSLSPLAIHTRNIREDARCSLVLQVCASMWERWSFLCFSVWPWASWSRAAEPIQEIC